MKQKLAKDVDLELSPLFHYLVRVSIMQILTAEQRETVIAECFACRTISAKAVQMLAEINPFDLMIKELSLPNEDGSKSKDKSFK